MPDQPPVFVLLGEARPNVTVEADPPAVSAVTGRLLRRMEIRVSVAEHQHEDLLEQVQAARSDQSPIRDTNDARWRVTNSSYSYNDGSTPVVYRHTFTLDEVEELFLTEIVFDGVRAQVAANSIDARDGQVVLSVLVDADQDLHERIEDAIERRRGSDAPYFPVEWPGILNDPMSMRFGQCLWQSEHDGAAKHRLVLVSERGDADREPWVGINEPAMSRLTGAAASTQDRMTTLIDELHHTGVLSDEAVARIAAAADSPSRRSRREFQRTTNIEEHLD